MTYVLLASIAVMYAVQLTAGPMEDPFIDIRLGANYPPLVWEGQWDRLVTANWMHARGMVGLHILMNGLGLYLLGRALEVLLGHARFFIIYVIGCLGGAVASTVAAMGSYSLGASTGIVGLFAAIGWVLFRFRDDLPTPMRNAIRQWVLLLVANVVLWVLLDDLGIDHAGHGGGFVAGGLAAILLTIGWPPFTKSRLRERVAGAVALALAGVVVAGLAVSGYRYVTDGTGDRSVELRVLREVVSRPEDERDPLLLNFYAWFVAIDPDASPEMIALATDMAEEALEKQATDEPPLRAATTDTLATLYYRSGRYDEAVTLERRALNADSSQTTYVSQLARFLYARLEDRGVLAEPPNEAPEVELIATESRSGDPEWILRIRGEHPNGLMFYAVADRDGELVGLVRGVVPRGAEPPSRMDRRPFPEGTRVRVALVDVELDPAPEGDFSLSHITMDPTVLSYPGPVED